MYLNCIKDKTKKEEEGKYALVYVMCTESEFCFILIGTEFMITVTSPKQ